MTSLIPEGWDWPPFAGDPWRPAVGTRVRVEHDRTRAGLVVEMMGEWDVRVLWDTDTDADPVTHRIVRER